MIWLLIPGAAIMAAVLWGPVVSNVEQAKYSIINSNAPFEIRDYAPKIIAQTDVNGPRKEAISEGFRIIADYIFGNNTSAKKIDMTAPVIQQEQQKIAMTAPVMQTGSDNNWTVAFVMPENYTLDTLPKPKNDLVKLIEIPQTRIAAIRFSGRATDQNLRDRSAELMSYIKAQNLKPVSAPSYAFYNPPWTLPFMRRNEVLIEISK